MGASQFFLSVSAPKPPLLSDPNQRLCKRHKVPLDLARVPISYLTGRLVKVGDRDLQDLKSPNEGTPSPLGTRRCAPNCRLDYG